MPNNTENIPVYNDTNTSVLNINEDELLEEIRQSLLENTRSRCTIQPGEFTYKQLSEKLGYSERTLHDRMKILTESGKWQKLDRINEQGNRVTVFRKVS